MPPRRRIVCAVSLALLLLLIAQWSAPRALAHPLSQGFMELTVSRGKIRMMLRVTLEEVLISTRQFVGDDDLYHLKHEVYTKHGEYLLKHVYLTADGKPLQGKMISATEPEKARDGLSPLDAQSMHAIYEMEYELTAPPAELKLSQDVLNEVNYTPGNPWQATYVLRVLQDEGEGDEGRLLTSKTPLSFAFKWPTVSNPPPDSTATERKKEPVIRQDRWRMARDYFGHGMDHIVGRENTDHEGFFARHIFKRADIGIDHLLFVSALVLGAASLWDLLKVVTAFTLAHSLTLTLCVLDIFRLPERVVEPMIALSIVFVAVENIFWPNRTRGWGRLGAAFFFGLFHGLGFAGGLLEAMQGIGGGAVLVAIVAFSVGVEIGHQVIVLPLFSVLRLLRRTQKDDAARENVSKLTLKYGSLVISVAGLFFLYSALRWTG